jgi:hypothetical protein
MVLGIAAIVCIVVFVVCAFILRSQMHRLSASYEAQMKALHAAELVLLEQRRRPNIACIEVDMRIVAQTSSVMRRNAGLFRLLWPHEYDRAFYAGERLIALSSRVLALSSR